MVKLSPNGMFLSNIDPRATSWRNEYPFESHYFEVRPNIMMHYVDEGPSRNTNNKEKVLVMFHGNPTWSFYYRNLIKHFSKEYRCIAMDHIGCGLSSKPALPHYSYQLEDRIRDAEALLKHLGIQRATFLLHDWGGAIGMGVAARNLSMPEKFVIFNTAAFRSENIPFSINICRIPLLGEFMVLGMNGFARVAQWRAIHDEDLLPKHIQEGYLAPYDSVSNRLAILKFVHDIPLKPEHPSYATLTSIEKSLELFKKLPMIILWGDADFCFDRHFRHEWQRRFPRAECYAFGDGGHYILEDKKNDIIRHLERFLPQDYKE